MCHEGYDHACGSQCIYPRCTELRHLSDPGSTDDVVTNQPDEPMNLKFWQKPKPIVLPGADRELVENFRKQFAHMKLLAQIVNERGIDITLSFGCAESRDYTTLSPQELNVAEIKRTRLESF